MKYFFAIFAIVLTVSNAYNFLERLENKDVN